MANYIQNRRKEENIGKISEIQKRKTIEKMNKTPNSYFKRINILIQPLSRLTKEKGKGHTN